MQQIATLDMYDWPEVSAEIDAFWSVVRTELVANGVDAPIALDRSRYSAEMWPDPDLLIAQTCGFPYVLGLCGDAEVFARGDYAVEGCGSGTYRSALLVRANAKGKCLADFRGTRVAINEWDSQSGTNTLKDALRPLAAPGEPFFSEVLVTGEHRRSARAVAEGRADIAALDAISWNLFQRFEPLAEGLRVLGWTAEVPSLPYITARSNARHAAVLQAALAKACAGVSAKSTRALPRAILPSCGSAYHCIREMQLRTAEVCLAPASNHEK